MSLVRLVAAVCIILLAGCATHPATPGAETEGDAPILQGYVLDPALRPLAGANITIAAVNATTVTDHNGHYAFRDLPGTEALVAVAEMPGYVPLGRSVQLSAGNSTMLNFTMVPVPTAKPYVEQQQFKGFLSCQAVLTANDNNNGADCGTSTTTNRNIWEFNVGSNVAGIVLETAWTPKSQLAQFLNATVETVGLGDQDAQLSAVEGASILRAQVTHDQSLKYYPEGGTVRIKINAATATKEQEQAAGLGLAAEQEFQIIASIFYVTPPDPTFSAATP